MTKKKKIISIASMSVLAIIATGFCFVMITGAFGFGAANGPWFNKCGITPVMQNEISSFVMWRMDQGVETLDLTTAQQSQYNHFRSQLQKSMEKGMANRMGFRKQVMDEFEKPSPDLSVILTGIESKINMVSASVSENLALFKAFYNDLDNNQKTKINKLVKKRMEAHKL